MTRKKSVPDTSSEHQSPPQQVTVVVVQQQHEELPRPTPRPADLTRWAKELDVTLFQGAMLLIGLEPFREIFLNGYTVPLLVDCMPEDKRQQFELIYGRSKQYLDRGHLIGKSREAKRSYPRIYVSLGDYLLWADTQQFAVPSQLRPLAPSAIAYRKDGTAIDSKDIVKRAEFVREVEARMIGGAAALNSFFSGARKVKGEVPEADPFRIFDRAGKPRKGYYDKKALMNFLAPRLTALLAGKRTVPGITFPKKE